MGGKSYFCDYCNCYLKNDVNVRKTHNAGLMHNIKKARYLRPFEDPEKVFLEESSKKTKCSRYLSGYCKFDLFCQYSHYSDALMEKLKKLVQKRKLRRQRHKKRKVVDTQLWSEKLTARLCKKLRLKKTDLPPSLRPTRFGHQLQNNCIRSEWGV